MDRFKIALAKLACEKVSDGMVVGLGAGTTVGFMVDLLHEHVSKEDLNIEFIAADKVLQKRAKDLGLKTLELNECNKIDLLFDGADYVNLKTGTVLKGNGGFVHPEKQLLELSEYAINLVDYRKLDFESLPKLFLELEPDFIYEFSNEFEYLNFYIRDQKSQSDNLIVEIIVDKFEDIAPISEMLKTTAGILAVGLFESGYDEIWVAGEMDLELDAKANEVLKLETDVKLFKYFFKIDQNVR